MNTSNLTSNVDQLSVMTIIESCELIRNNGLCLTNKHVMMVNPSLIPENKLISDFWGIFCQTQTRTLAAQTSGLIEMCNSWVIFLSTYSNKYCLVLVHAKAIGHE